MTDEINGDWLKAKIGSRRGVRLKLAKYIGIEPEKVSKITSGHRQIQGDEVLKIKEFFDRKLDSDGDGMNERQETYMDRALKKLPPRAPTGSMENVSLSVSGRTLEIHAVIDADDAERLIEKIRSLHSIASN